MALPDPSQFTFLDLDSSHFLEVLARHLNISRDADIQWIRQLQPAEERWLRECRDLWANMNYLLSTAPVGDVLKKSKVKLPMKRGNRTNMIYLNARFEVVYRGRDRMEVYREMVLPDLIASGEIATDDDGNPDPFQEPAAREAYKLFMDRQTARSRKSITIRNISAQK